MNLFNLSPSQLADAFSQLQGEAGTGAAQAGTQAMNSFLSLVTNPFANNRGFAEAPGVGLGLPESARRSPGPANQGAGLQGTGSRARSAPLGHLGRSLWRPKQHHR